MRFRCRIFFPSVRYFRRLCLAAVTDAATNIEIFTAANERPSMLMDSGKLIDGWPFMVYQPR